MGMRGIEFRTATRRPPVRFNGRACEIPWAGPCSCDGASYGSGFHWMRRYSIWPRSASRPMGPVAGSFNASLQDLPIAGAAGNAILHSDLDQIPILRLVVLQRLVGAHDEVVAALKLGIADEDAAVGVHRGTKLQLEDEIPWELLGGPKLAQVRTLDAT